MFGLKSVTDSVISKLGVRCQKFPHTHTYSYTHEAVRSGILASFSPFNYSTEVQAIGELGVYSSRLEYSD